MIDEMQKSIQQFYGSQPIKSLDYGRIVNQKRFNKLKTYLSQGEVIAGGDIDDSELYFAPTLIQNIKTEAPIMKEEIFGPILPIITYKEQQEALNIIHENPHPL